MHTQIVIHSSYLITRILRKFFQLLYHELSWTYDFISFCVSLGKWNQWVRSALAYLQGPLIFELGHGPGHLQVALNKCGVDCIGLDESSQMSLQAQRRLIRHHMQSALIRGQAQHLPFASGSIPQIVATFPSEYITENQTLGEIFRVLAPGGAVIILRLAWITGHNVLERLAAWLFKITGEAPIWDDRLLDPARTVGFLASSDIVQMPDSNLLFLILRKPSKVDNTDFISNHNTNRLSIEIDYEITLSL